MVNKQSKIPTVLTELKLNRENCQRRVGQLPVVTIVCHGEIAVREITTLARLSAPVPTKGLCSVVVVVVVVLNLRC